MKIFILTCLSLMSVIFFVSCDSGRTTNIQKENADLTEEEFVEVEEEYEEDCEECNGFGYGTYICLSCGGAGQTYQSTTETHPKECYNCYGTGKVRCSKCDGNGYIICEYCGGHGFSQCTTCQGYGIIAFDRNDPSTWIRCNVCSGKGYAKCSLCDGNGRYECRWYEDCPICYGSGYHGKESVSNSEYITCNECGGSGRYRLQCDECGGKGQVIKTRVVQKKKADL